MPAIRELKILRHQLPKRDAATRSRDFGEVDRGFTPATAMVEASRCVQCVEAPCAINGCPLSNQIPLWLDHVVNGRFRKAADVLSQTTNLPEACGKLCPHEVLCESHCVVGRVSEPVSIGRLEEFVSKTAREKKWWRSTPVRPAGGRRVAIVGAGPAGLSACEELLDRGHSVTVFDKYAAPGGLLVFGIPEFKFAGSRMDGIVERLEEKGAEFQCGVEIGGNRTLDSLMDTDGFDAVLLAVGAEKARRANLPGEDLFHVHFATPFLIEANLFRNTPKEERAPSIEPTGYCVVIGGGDTAMDCVRSAVRLGFERVVCLYRRSEAEMPGRAEDKKHAIAEGVGFQYLSAPVAFLPDDQAGTTCRLSRERERPGQVGKRVRAVRCIRNELGEPDESGRRRPVPIAGSEFELRADTVVLALGYEVKEEPAASANVGMLKNRISVNEGLATDRVGIFAAGDARRGADLIVTAVNDGRRAAAAIHQYLATL